MSPDDVRRVVKLDGEPVLRNLLITQGYHDLSQAMRDRTGGNAINWCTLGTWASKTAGTFIRNEEIPRAFRALLDRQQFIGRVAAALDPLRLLDLVSRIVTEVSAYIMTGNRVVFAELAQVFADFMAALGADRSPDPERLRRFQDTLTDGDPEPDRVTWDEMRKVLVVKPAGGQGRLRDMAACYYQAMFERDVKRRAELLLLGNAYGGIHEQTRLQPYIAGSIDSPIAETLLAHTHDHVERTVGTAPLRAAAHATVDQAVPPVARAIERLWEEFSTIELMTLTLPDGVLHLGFPIPNERGMPPLPPALASIDHPVLRKVLSGYNALDVRIEPTPLERIQDGFRRFLGHRHPATRVAIAVGAHDWVNLDERMRYILVLFRSRAEDQNLADQPFTDEQVVDLRAGRMPRGRM